MLKDWRTLALIAVGSSVAGLVLTALVLVETPMCASPLPLHPLPAVCAGALAALTVVVRALGRHYIMTGNRDKAVAAQKRLRTADSDVMGAVEELERSQGAADEGGGGGIGMLCGSARKALFIGVFLMFVQQREQPYPPPRAPLAPASLLRRWLR